MDSVKQALVQLFLPYQIQWLKDKSLIKIWSKSRRIGATFVQAYEDVQDIVERREYTPGRPVTRVYFASKDEDAGKEYIEYCLRYAKVFQMVANDLGTEIIEEDNNKKVKRRTLEFANGGKIIALSSAPTAFNSKGGKIVWDEAALHKDQKSMWSGAQPAAKVWGYPIRILSTHKGKLTWFFRACKRAKEGMNGFSLHTVTIVDAVREGLYNRVMNRETTEEEREAYVEEIRRSCDDEETFQEDYMANPQDATTAYFPYDIIMPCEHDGVLRTLEQLEECKGNLYGGWDVARHRDMSVITIIEKLGLHFYVRFIHAMEKTPFKIQRVWLNKTMILPRMLRMCIDQSGIGLPLAEDAQEKYGAFRVEGITFSAQIKERMAVDCRQNFEDRRIIIPDDETLRESIHSIKKFVTSAGNTRFDAERTDATGHADHFWALALSLHAGLNANCGPTWAESQPLDESIGKLDKYIEKIPFHAY